MTPENTPLHERPMKADILYGFAHVNPDFAVRIIPLTRRERFWRLMRRIYDLFRWRC